MENINVTLGIQDDGIQKISELVRENIENSIAETVKDNFQEEITDSVIEYMKDDYDISGHISDWIEYNFDIEDHLRNVNLNDYINDSNDVESQIQNLLEQYSPLSSCRTSELATKAMRNAMRYFLLKDDELVDDIAKALSRLKEKSKLEEMRESIIMEAKPSILENFKLELKEYFDTLDAEKAKEQNELFLNSPYAPRI